MPKVNLEIGRKTNWRKIQELEAEQERIETEINKPIEIITPTKKQAPKRAHKKKKKAKKTKTRK